MKHRHIGANFAANFVANSVAIALAAFAPGAMAQTLKPGLWEFTNNVRSANPQMEAQMAQAREQMANLPPEQRKMMEEMMAQRGIKLGGGPGGGMTVKVCMTREMVERNEFATQQRGDCKTTQQSRTGNTLKVAFTCTNPPSSGEGQVTFAGPEAYSMKMTVNTTMQGRPETMNVEGSGKWLAADCGDIKPLSPPKR